MTSTTVLHAPITDDSLEHPIESATVPALDNTPAVTPAGERLARRAHDLTLGAPMLALLAAIVRAYLHPQPNNDEGASTAEWVIGVAIAATLAIAVGAIIVAKVTAKATSIDLG